jgi:hypothetical protein
MRTSHRFAIAALLTLATVVVPIVVLLLPRLAHADPPFGFGDNALEDRFADGDLDADDIARMPALGHARAGSADVQAKTWVSLLGFASQFPTGAHEVGAGIVVGIAFDKIAQGSSHVASEKAPPFFGDGPTPAPTPSPPPRESPAPAFSTPSLSISGVLARGAVKAAWRSAGIEITDARVDEMIARARRSAALPEVRLRALRVLNSGEDVTYVDASGHVYDTIGANLSLEARLTWRLDRLIFADDEPTLERVRLERQEARGRLGTHVLELLFAWQRALFDLASTPSGSRSEMEAVLRRFESEVALDVLTSGWFGVQAAVRKAGKTSEVAP